MQYPWNWPTILQVIGRLFRIGNERTVDWTILHVTGTMYDVAEDKMNRKFCEQLRLESQIPPFVKGLRLQRMIAYEIIRLTFGQPFNRFAWVMNPPAKVQDYDSKLNEVLGSIFSTIVSEVTSQPDPDHESVQVLLARLELCIPKIAALVKRNPDDPIWLNVGVSQLVEMAESFEDEVSIGWPWWSNKAGISRGDWNNAAGTLFDLDEVATDTASDNNNNTPSAPSKAAGDKALGNLLGVQASTGLITPENVRALRRVMLDHGLCNEAEKVKRYFFEEFPELMDFLDAPPTPEQAGSDD